MLKEWTAKRGIGLTVPCTNRIRSSFTLASEILSNLPESPYTHCHVVKPLVVSVLSLELAPDEFRQSLHPSGEPEICFLFLESLFPLVCCWKYCYATTLSFGF